MQAELEATATVVKTVVMVAPVLSGQQGVETTTQAAVGVKQQALEHMVLVESVAVGQHREYPARQTLGVGRGLVTAPPAAPAW